MVAPSVPITLDQEYRLRFAQPDLIAIEEKLGSVLSLFSPDKMGYSVARVLVWRGLHTEKENGELVHVFPLTPSGLDRAGEFVLEYVRSTEGSFPALFDKLAPGFALSLGFGDPTPSKAPQGADPKNP